MIKLTQRQRTALAWAVGRAAGWRGELTGDPDTGSLIEFEVEVRHATSALRALGISVPRGAEDKSLDVFLPREKL